MKPTLLILAAGMGSRYGSLKQMDGIGPNKEAILDYSIFDAIRAGFGKVVFVIRKSFVDDFKAVFSEERFGGKIKVEYVFQELDALPEGFSVPEGREKPWGTNHALMMAKDVIKEPFAAINADDFYGADAYKVIAEYLTSLEGKRGSYCMVGYQVKNTLSEYGSVSRGVCTANENGDLVSIVERTSIEKQGEEIVFMDDDNTLKPIEVDSLVSMNFFGFTPDYFEYSDSLFEEFLTENSANLKSEFFIPLVTNTLINSGKATLKVLSSDAKWFGVTYKEDRPQVVKQLGNLISAGVYPEKLWE
ncbi:MAG: sugar phosphate nucleotidyltransferase [Rikenellaceae bacterium]